MEGAPWRSLPLECLIDIGHNVIFGPVVTELLRKAEDEVEAHEVRDIVFCAKLGNKLIISFIVPYIKFCAT